MGTKINSDTKLKSPLTGDDVKSIMKSYSLRNYNKYYVIKDYIVQKASDTMLGFLGDYWKLNVYLSASNEVKKTEYFFIKSVPSNNEAKAAMVRDIKVFQTETAFYTEVKVKLDIPSIKPWSPNLVAALHDALVFEDLNAMGYRMKNKFQRLDKAHTLQGLRTLARFHASSIISEETKKAKLNKPYKLIDDCNTLSSDGGYVETDLWFVQCRKGGLEAIKAYSKYGQGEVFQNIENTWANIWNASLQLSGCSEEHRNVVCHRDLWNNNIFFHYKVVAGSLEPDDCLLVDFQAVKYQPPACDVMLFLQCNLHRKLREENIDAFLNFYYKELEAILLDHNISLNDIIPKDSFMESAEQQRQWGLIVFACLVPSIFLDDESMTRFFTDAKQFDQIMMKDKSSFMKAMMQENTYYRNIVLETLEEIVERFPVDPHRKRKWVEAVRRQETWMPTKHTQICGIHFQPECYNINSKKQRKLYKDSVPTL